MRFTLVLSLLVPLGASSLVLACSAAGRSSHSPTPGGARGEPARMSPDPKYLKPGEKRTFAIEYTAEIAEVPAGTKLLRVWAPVPADSVLQTIRDLRFEDPRPSIGVEPEHGNRIAYWEIREPKGPVALNYGFTCERREHVTDLAAVAEDGTESDASAEAFLADDALTVVDDRIRTMAAEVTAGRTTTLAKARAIYDRVLEHMKYDKSGTGWGRGDTAYACDAGAGNCTDFHALFMSLARASGIPAGFEIGLYLPYEAGKQETPGGYHCWSFFRVPGKTWVPIDASEADRFPERADYFFGAHTPNRVTMSVGRDLVLEPPQQGEPLNYLLNPYAEADGEPVATSKTWAYRDL